VGSTIYPGMMVTAAFLFRLFERLELGISLNDVCVFIPAGFGVTATLFTMGIAYEASRSANAALFTGLIMAIIPSHLMRSVAGGYDNESIAVTAITCTFYLWLRCLRGPSSWPMSILAGISYVYMVATWGGYVFVLNMIGVHAILLVMLGYYTAHLHKVYSIWYVIGTLGAIQFPIVGLLPFQSMEQLGPLGVFLIMQFLYVFEKFQTRFDQAKFQRHRNSIIAALVLGGAVVFSALHSMGLVYGLSNRVRSLFVPHTHTGNPLVDSVAEHQSTPNTVYWHYFHATCYLGPIGFVWSLATKRTPSKYFVFLYCLLAGYFSRKMIRLVLLLAPAASIAAGIAVHLIFDWAWTILSAGFAEYFSSSEPAAAGAAAGAAGAQETDGGATSPKGKEKKAKGKEKTLDGRSLSALYDSINMFKLSSDPIVKNLQLISAIVVPLFIGLHLLRFTGHCWAVSSELSHPTIIVKARSHTGEPIMLDDFRQAYWYLRDKTAPDARVLAWWDYGYQINGIGNRTSIADGNTWNHEHIALVGRCLISPEEEAHRIIRHLADYVLVWTTRYAGMAGDDLAKMPHMARISSSVFHDLNANDYWIDQNQRGSPKLMKSILWKMHFYGYDPSVKLSKFEEAYTSPNRMVRIFKVKDVGPRHPVGQYPKALDFVLKKSRAYKQH
jgi:dolichyl-diphosphooligosaccharide---protein glycosyltransferase